MSATLNSTLSAFVKGKRDIAVVRNPIVGKFAKELKSISDTDKNAPNKSNFLEVLENSHVINSYIINDKYMKRFQEKQDKGEIDIENILAINKNRDCIKPYQNLFSEVYPKFSLVPDDRAFRRNAKGNKIIFEDRFNKLGRNADYSKVTDELFSEDHLYYGEEGYSGFSDYSIVGEDFSEAGFAPFAVAIHIVYFDKEKSLRVKHFVSDSNEDYNDPAGKFGEAIVKLASWANSEKTKPTVGLRKLIECYSEGKYPGLGTVKKLTIMHHLELMNLFLEEKYSK
jgi:hypothetical protein